jgi:hypothetical protein
MAMGMAAWALPKWDGGCVGVVALALWLFD